jgi:hypothetical protein
MVGSGVMPSRALPCAAVAAPFLERQHLARFVEDVGAIQIDSINVLDRAPYLTVWSRFGPYDRGRLDRLVYRCACGSGGLRRRAGRALSPGVYVKLTGTGHHGPVIVPRGVSTSVLASSPWENRRRSDKDQRCWRNLCDSR